MKVYQSISDVISDLPNLSWDASFYYNQKDWNLNPLKTKIAYLNAKEEDQIEWIQTENDNLPKIIRENDMKAFFDVETMRDIISVQRKNDPASTIEDYIKAIDYYAEQDTFLPA